MKLIVGLGNPGKKYAANRHNLGFMIIDAFAVARGLEWTKNGDLMCEIAKDGELIVIKPQTFMNKSGDSVRAVANFYKIDPKDILVINDDVDLEFGKIRLAFGGASAGHLGIESVTEGLATADFNRLKTGIGRPEVGEVDDFVLSDFSPEEKGKLEAVIKKAVEAIKSYLESGVEATMNRFN
ncbi:aminoacyl-tRNA hydrolase [Candidatus Curtissbacteria bacterium]|nr:aminoacyl-tRNA hydrolase [Candidatus Curtissbacteria bacterium]